MLADGDAKVTLPPVMFTVTTAGALEGGVPAVPVGIPNDKVAGETVICACTAWAQRRSTALQRKNRVIFLGKQPT
jgi:hypothetical protein